MNTKTQASGAIDDIFSDYAQLQNKTTIFDNSSFCGTNQNQQCLLSSSCCVTVWIHSVGVKEI